MSLSFGILGSIQGNTLDELRRLWRWADTAGFDLIAVSDHLAAHPVSAAQEHFEAVATLAALAGETRRARIGCLVFSVTFRQPGVLAKSLVTIDHLSGGRVEVGIGAGWVESEHRMYGLPFESIGVREDRLEEYVQCLRLLFDEPVATFRGRHYALEEARCEPKPVQGRLPVWIGGLGEKRTLPTVAKYADGWNGGLLTPQGWIQKSRLLDELCERNGRDPATLARSVNLGFFLGVDAPGVARQRDRYERFTAGAGGRTGSLLGTPDQVIETVAAYRDAGVPRLTIAVSAPYDWEALEAYATEVMPAFAGEKVA